MQKGIIGKKIGMTQLFDENGMVLVLSYRRRLSRATATRQFSSDLVRLSFHAFPSRLKDILTRRALLLRRHSESSVLNPSPT